jgi:hypothetical protein
MTMTDEEMREQLDRQRAFLVMHASNYPYKHAPSSRSLVPAPLPSRSPLATKQFVKTLVKGLVPVIADEIKATRKEIAELRQQIDELKAKVDPPLAARLQAIEDRLAQLPSPPTLRRIA